MKYLTGVLMFILCFSAFAQDSKQDNPRAAKSSTAKKPEAPAAVDTRKAVNAPDTASVKTPAKNETPANPRAVKKESTTRPE